MHPSSMWTPAAVARRIHTHIDTKGNIKGEIEFRIQRGCIRCTGTSREYIKKKRTTRLRRRAAAAAAVTAVAATRKEPETYSIFATLYFSHASDPCRIGAVLANVDEFFPIYDSLVSILLRSARPRVAHFSCWKSIPSTGENSYEVKFDGRDPCTKANFDLYKSFYILKATFHSMTILSSREHTCIQPKVENLSKTALCNELRDPQKNKKGCPFYNETNKGVLSSHDRLASVGLETPWDIEDLVAVGRQANACPYFGARNLMGEASIVFCPYNYLIDPSIRESMGIDLTNEIVIVDEAHNIESICRDAGSAEFREDALLEAAEDCHLLYNRTEKKCSYYDIIHRYLLKLHEVISDVYVPESSTKYGETHSDFWKGNELWTKLTANGLGEDNYSAFKVACRTAINEYNQMKEDIAKEAENNEDRWKKLKDPITISHITKNLLVLMEMALMCVKDSEFSQDYRCVISKAYHQDVKTKPAKSGEWVDTRGEVKKPQFLRTLKFLCMNPAIIFRGMARNARSVILASGTLSPTTTFEGELGLTFAHQLHANHVITKDQVYVRPIGRGPNGVSLKAVYANVSTFDFKDELGSLLVQVCETVPHGVLCFFSSYAMMTSQLERWDETGVRSKLEARKCIVQEPRYSGDLDAMMREYRDAIRDTAAGRSRATGWDGALMFAVFRGKVAEGIDFSDNEARCVITVSSTSQPGLFKDLLSLFCVHLGRYTVRCEERT
ncbi:unnamed protein product [Trichogramma brassicae]|uniref:Helicase ATP-binding domain-containing protein n=1 Tax=Trichogramma brassicae TaxID=86971 RepID=A0A6H5I7D5_9HYME|nr:unnamed protein product [Trichogramma brassicae]